MGNSSSKNPNEATVSLRINNFTLNNVPQMPNKFSGRVDTRTWLEFTRLCQDAVALPDAAERKAKSSRLTCYIVFAGIAVMIGFMYGFLGGFLGGVNGETGVLISAIIVAVFGFIGGLVMLLVSTTRVQNLQQTFIKDVKNRLSERLNAINHKYANIIQFNMKADSSPFGQAQRNNPQQSVGIQISIQVLVQSVQYIEAPLPFGANQYGTFGQPQVQVVQSQPQMYQPQQIVMNQTQSMPQGGQPQIVMIQMPDGRMVPAQIMGTVQQQPANNNVAAVSAPAYNPAADNTSVAEAQPWQPQVQQVASVSVPEEEEEFVHNEQGEGEGATNGGDQWQ